MFQVGDVVILKNHPDKHEGVVVSIWPDPYNGSLDEYTIQFKDPDLIPQRMAYHEIDLEMAPLPEGQSCAAPLKCECGRDTFGAGRHSHYCPKVIFNDQY